MTLNFEKWQVRENDISRANGLMVLRSSAELRT